MIEDLSAFQTAIKHGIPDILPTKYSFDATVSHAPVRNLDGVLTKEERLLAISNALRYFKQEFHAVLAKEFADELDTYGRIYMYRFLPSYRMYSRPVDQYPAKCHQAAAIMLIIQNNLDHKVAKHPHELITYGGNGAVFQNWAQYLLVMKYLSVMTDEQTLVLYSGHPLGLFPSHKDAPRVVVTNGMMIPNHSSKNDWNKYNALGVTQYGQMTAGSFMYIGPQGIVHGTTITLLNAGRMLGLGENLRGKVFLTSGLGGMSGAQALAGIITEAVTIIAETDKDAVDQRVADGYIFRENVYTDLVACISHLERARAEKVVITLIYHGNVVDLLEYFVENNIKIELGSDQTSLHNIDDMGYTPVGYSFEEAKKLMLSDRIGFKSAVEKSLIRHVKAVNALTSKGMYFWDYGNAFLKEAGKAGADVFAQGSDVKYRYPSYVEDIMGPLCFDYGFGPFRWVCTSALQEDLDLTDKIAESVILELIKSADNDIIPQLNDNLQWIRNAKEQIPVVGSKSRILYADAEGRIAIAKAFNNAINQGALSGPVVLGRDHHDVSGTDSPYRETSNIYDGSSFTADMAVHNVIGDSFRGATWVSIHNGGGVGWGEVINGGFGMVLDGSDDAERRLTRMLHWDVYNGIARRSWARNEHAIDTIKKAKVRYPNMMITEVNLVDKSILDGI